MLKQLLQLKRRHNLVDGASSISLPGNSCEYDVSDYGFVSSTPKDQFEGMTTVGNENYTSEKLRELRVSN